MKRTAQLFIVSLFAGAITLGAYKLFFEKETYQWVPNNPNGTYVTTSNLNTSAKGAGINEVDFTVAAEKTVNAVVHVKNITSRGFRSSSSFFYGSRSEPQVPQGGTGSGVIISPDGYIVTNNHVISGATQLEITLNNNKSYEAEVIGTDATFDIALIKVEVEEPLPYLAFGDSDNSRIGEWVLAVGNPFNLTSTVTAGIVSAKARALSLPGQSYIQTDAAVNPGNSGGALVNTNGDLIGINTAITSQTGSFVGYSFAVPSNIAKKVVNDLLEFGSVQKGILGVSAVSTNTQKAKQEGLDEIEGVYIDRVEEDSGAYDAKLQKGDIIKQVDEIKVKKFSELTGYLSAKRPGDQVNLTIDRDGKNMIVPVKLKKRLTEQLPVIGFTVKDLSRKDKKQYGVDQGVKIVDIPGDFGREDLIGQIIIEVNDDPVKNLKSARELFSNLSIIGRSSFVMINKDGDRERIVLR